MPEKFANNAQTTLNGAITNIATTLVVTSASAFPTSGNFRIIIESEIMLVTGVSGTTFTVTRGYESTSNVAHGTLSIVTQVLTAGSLDVAYARIDQANGASSVNGSSQLVQLDSGSSVAKGSLLAGTGSATVGVLAVGTNNKLVIADSTQATGLNYADIQNIQEDPFLLMGG